MHQTLGGRSFVERSVADRVAVADLLACLDVPLGRWRAPLLIGVFGLPGTGKTEMSYRLARRYPLVMLTTDAIRLRYGLPSGPATHAVMYEVARALLPRRVAVLFDSIHPGRGNRLHLREFATRHQAESAVIFTTAQPAIVEARLQARQEAPARTARDGKFVITPQHFARIANYLEPPTVDEAIWTVDTSHGDLDAQLAGFERWLDTQMVRPHHSSAST
jgi:predicted kinase